MLEHVTADVFLWLATASAESESITWTDVGLKLREALPPWMWVSISLGAVALLFLLGIGDQLAGILGWLGIESPFAKQQVSDGQLENTRNKLLRIVSKDFDARLATSLHELVKLDLYMEDQRQKVGKSRLELVPKDIDRDDEDLSLPINRVLYQKGKDKKLLSLKLTQKMIDVFERSDIQGKLLILGEPGSGKTTELLHLAQDLAKRANEQKNAPVPVILELSTWKGEPIEFWVKEQFKKRFNIAEAVTHQWLESFQILLLLDGLDELELVGHKCCIQAINGFLETTHTTELVVCCRRAEYEAGQIELSSLEGAVYLEDLKIDQIRQYFIKLKRLTLWNELCDNKMLTALAQKPLFLSMLVVAYQENAIQSENDLFDAYIEKQLADIRNQRTYKLGKISNSKQTMHYLIWLAKQLERIGETEFLIEQMQPSWLASKKQIALYKTAFVMIVMLILGLLLILSDDLIFGLLLSLLFGPIDGMNSEWITNRLIQLLSSWLIIGLMIGLILWRSDSLNRIKPKEQVIWHLRKVLSNDLSDLLSEFLNSGKFLIALGVLIFGLYYVLIDVIRLLELYNLTNELRHWSDDLMATLIIGLSIIPILLLGYELFFIVIDFLGGSVMQPNLVREEKIPNQCMKKSIQNILNYGLIIGLIIVLITGLSSGLGVLIEVGADADADIEFIVVLIFVLIYGLKDGLIIGLIYGLIGGLVSGLKPTIQHFILRLLLTQNGSTPWNYELFLEYTVRLKFIQRTGGRYRFIHDLLRKHFAKMPLTR